MKTINTELKKKIKLLTREMIGSLTSLGILKKDIADLFNVHPDSISNWISFNSMAVTTKSNFIKLATIMLVSANYDPQQLSIYVSKKRLEILISAKKEASNNSLDQLNIRSSSWEVIYTTVEKILNEGRGKHYSTLMWSKE